MVDLAGGAPPRRAGVMAGLVRLAQHVRLAFGWTLAPLQRRTALGLAGGLAAVMTWSFWRYEGITSNVVFTAATTLALGALVVLAARRILFAAVAMAGLIAIINGVSSAKQKMIGMVLHAYDIVFTPT